MLLDSVVKEYAASPFSSLINFLISFCQDMPLVRVQGGFIFLKGYVQLSLPALGMSAVCTDDPCMENHKGIGCVLFLNSYG